MEAIQNMLGGMMQVLQRLIDESERNAQNNNVHGSGNMNVQVNDIALNLDQQNAVEQQLREVKKMLKSSVVNDAQKLLLATFVLVGEVNRW